jgi:hypothetical protein
MGALLTGLAVAAAAAPAPQAAITGTLSVPGYTVMALAADGRVTTASATTGRFRIRPPDARVTLQLRAPDGTYAGPIVVGPPANHVIVGVKAGAVLGRITFVPRLGYATARRVAPRWLDRTRWARTRGNVEPFGARSMGRELAAPLKHPPPGDTDGDGVPDVLDVDDDGDLILDEVDPPLLPDPVRVTSQLVEIEQPLNVDAGARSSEIDAGLVKNGWLTLASTVPGTPDCALLRWCPATAGTFQPHATSDQLRAGDIVIAGGMVGAVGSVYATVPAIAAYSDDAGRHELRQPLDPGTVLPLVGSQVRFELWRPQRRAMPADEVAEDEGKWVDMGGLPFSVGTAVGAPCGPPLIDSAPDVPSGEGDTVAYTLDVGQCLAAAGQSFAPGEQATLLFTAGGATAGYAFVNAGP